MNIKKIQEIQRIGTLAENERLNEIISMIPSNTLYIKSVTLNIFHLTL